MCRLEEIAYIVYECSHCKGRLSIPIDTPMIRFDYCPVCRERIDKSLSSALEALIDIARARPKEIILEFRQCS